ncbi:ABC transporter substrate-binding protein [Demetria terragena]|uniref:ABC transporter substrate-binding protein n=1 Tax=Demetria terragena TaxID=63959 RepID=UPI0003806393|nr:ABC transporter substrate-binding protein [Demetria terragena]
MASVPVRRRLLALVAITTMGTASCSAGAGNVPDGAGVGEGQRNVRIGLAAEPTSLDFTKNDGVAIPQVELGNIYETLVKQSQNGDLVPGLAKGWTVSKDRKTYVFTLWPGVKFSDGSAFTAADAVWSINQVKSDAWTISLKAGMDPVKKAEAVSPTRLKVTLKQPSNSWLYAMTTRIGAMFPEGAKDLATKPVGTGPFVFSHWKRGDSIVLRRNENYWGKQPYFKSVALLYFKDSISANNAMKSRTIDVLGTVQAPETMSEFPSDDFTIVEGTTNSEVVLSMNASTAPFNDKRVRLAARHAINKKSLIDTCWAGYGKQIGSMVPPTDPWYEDLTGVTPYDPAKAKRLLKQSGKADKPVRLRLPSLPYAASCGPVVKSALEQVGFTVKVDVLEFPAAWLTSVLTGSDYELSMIAHAEPRDMAAVFGNPDYYTHFQNPQMATLLKRADTGTPNQQIEAMKSAGRLIAQEGAADFLFVLPNLIVSDKDITGLPENSITEGFDLAALKRS